MLGKFFTIRKIEGRITCAYSEAASIYRYDIFFRLLGETIWYSMPNKEIKAAFTGLSE